MPVKTTSLSLSGGLLPLVPIKRQGKPDALKGLLVAPPGWGKTEFVMSNPRCLLLACEEGHGATDGYKIRITGWDDSEKYPVDERNPIPRGGFLQVVGALQKSEGDIPYDSIGVDTIDVLIKMLVDEKLPTLRDKDGKRVAHMSDVGFGKGYDLGQNSPFRKEFNKLVKLGLNIFFLTHEKKKDSTFQGKGTTTKKETTLPNGIFEQIFPMMDVILHGVFGKKRKGQMRRDRIFVTEGSEDILAKNRYGLLPPAWLVNHDEENRWQEFLDYFDPKTHEDAVDELNKIGYDLESL